MRFSSLLLSLFTLVSLGACSRPAERQPPAGFLQKPANIAAGHRLFEAHCAQCHGTLEEGRMAKADTFVPPPPDFTSPRYRHVTPGYLFRRISKGKTVEPYLSSGSVMPAWGPYFSDTQIWQLVAYLRHRPSSSS